MLSLLVISLLAADPIKSAGSGPWSAPDTWEGGKVPGKDARVLVRAGHRVVFDVQTAAPVRGVCVAGTLAFATDRDTRLDVGLIKIEATDRYSESGFDCDAHFSAPVGERPALEIGTQAAPLPAKHKALIRLHLMPGMDKESFPAIVCCGGRMDLHGAPLNRTWVKLGATAKKGEASISLAEAVTGWNVGDRVILTATSHPTSKKRKLTEERLVKAIDGKKVTLDKALDAEHRGEGPYRGEVADLSRNVVVESADRKARGHTMYHRGSAGSISYAEFRHLGKEGVLGRYALHYHLCKETMRGSSLIGASIWDSGNRWVTIHGTNHLVVRDTVGYGSVGHGFFLEDGTEVHNVLDRNLAVGARPGKRLPKQILRFDANNGAGFWWANSLNTFTRNVAVDNGEYGFRYEATPSSAGTLVLPILQPDGTTRRVDIRTLPFVRFEGNETHSNTGNYGVNLGEGVRGVGPDTRHPFIVRDLLVWNTHYGFRPQVPSLLVENLRLHGTVYGIYHPNYDNHVYKNVTINGNGSEPFNRGHDDASVQHGAVTVDGLTFEGTSGYKDSIPLIQLTDDNPTGKAVVHIRGLKVTRKNAKDQRSIAAVGGGAHVEPSTATGVPVYLHDYFGTGRHAKICLTTAKDFAADGLAYRDAAPLTGPKAKVAEAKDIVFPKLLDPVDDMPPTTVVTHVVKHGGKLRVRGTTADNGTVKRVIVNGQEAKATAANFAEWEITIPQAKTVSAHAEDAAGNVEKRFATRRAADAE